MGGEGPGRRKAVSESKWLHEKEIVWQWILGRYTAHPKTAARGPSTLHSTGEMSAGRGV
jgi:hypothetical protein